MTLAPWSHECEPCRRADTEGWTGPINGRSDAAHCHDCHRSWTGHRELHCPVCHEHFSSERACDAHEGPDGCRPPQRDPHPEGRGSAHRAPERLGTGVGRTRARRRPEPLDGRKSASPTA